MNKQIKLIRKWAKLRHSDKKFLDIAIAYYETLDTREQKAMIKEFQDYIDAVVSGTIEASVPTIPIPVIKKDDNEKYLKDYYNGK